MGALQWRRPSRRRRRTARAGVLAAVLVVGSGLSTLTAPPAGALGTYTHRICDFVSYGQWSLEFCVGFDYSGTANGNRLRGYADADRTVVGPGVPTIIISKVNLGDGNGIISVAPSNGSTTGVVQNETPLNYQCHRGASSNYNVHAYFSARFPDGHLTTWDFFAYYWQSVGTPDDVCTDNNLRYYYQGAPFPPGEVANAYG